MINSFSIDVSRAVHTHKANVDWEMETFDFNVQHNASRWLQILKMSHWSKTDSPRFYLWWNHRSFVWVCWDRLCAVLIKSPAICNQVQNHKTPYGRCFFFDSVIIINLVAEIEIPLPMLRFDTLNPPIVAMRTYDAHPRQIYTNWCCCCNKNTMFIFVVEIELSASYIDCCAPKNNLMIYGGSICLSRRQRDLWLRLLNKKKIKSWFIIPCFRA